MVVKLYAIFDKVAGVYGEPFSAANQNIAIRRFQYIMSKSEMVALDCALYELCSYNLELGNVVGSSKFVCNYVNEVKDEKN